MEFFEIEYAEWAAQVEANRIECDAYAAEKGYDWS